MIATDVPARTTILTDAQVRQISREGYLTYGTCISQDELIALRFAYERVFEKFDSADASRFGGGEWERVANLEGFHDQKALVSIIANPTIIAIAGAALGTCDIEYTGSILRRTLFGNELHTKSENGFPWHTDLFISGDPASAPDDRVAIWLYLDDVTIADGATQMLPGSTALHRENLRGGLPFNHGLDEHIAHAEDEANGVFVQAPAGGGMAFKSYVLHRAVLNRNGVPRRIMTLDYRVRGSRFVPDGNFQKLSAQARRQLTDCLPEAAHSLVS